MPQRNKDEGCCCVLGIFILILLCGSILSRSMVGEIILVIFTVVIASAVGGVTAFMVTEHYSRKQDLAKIAAILCVIAIFIWIVIPHTIMSIRLCPLKYDFMKVATQNSSSEYVDRTTVDNKSIVDLDYNEALDAVVKKRKKYLADNGYIGFGGWYVDDAGPTTSMIYVYFGSWLTK